MVLCSTCGTTFAAGRCPLCRTAAPASTTASGARGAAPASGTPSSPAAPATSGARGAAPASGTPSGPAAPATAGVADPRVISGTLVRVDGPREMPAANPWRTACVILGTLVLLPIVIGCMFLALAIRIAMQMVGIRSGGGSGLLTAFSPFRMLGTGDGQRAMIPTYQLVVNTPLGTRVARQEGEFQSAQPLVGHEVTLRGGLRDGVLVVTGGIDNTIGTRFVRRPNGWAALFMVLLAAATGGIIALATSR